jgi:ribosomal protein S18 acetylase RimI-like enzyme
VTGVRAEIRPTIDRGWLERQAAEQPLTHAFALWDLERAPDRVRFFSAFDRDTALGYLLVWLGHPTATIVHWVGRHPIMQDLAAMLPPRPLVALVPPEVRDLVLSARGPGREFPLLQMARPQVPPRGPSAALPGVRPLDRHDHAPLAAWARRQADPLVAAYPYLDPEADRIWGAFEGETLVGAVHAEVRLPRVWVLGGIYVDPDARRRGWGHKLVQAAVDAAEEAGARVGLYVREDRDDARQLYEGLGFQTVDRRIWVDLGAGLAP